MTWKIRLLAAVGMLGMAGAAIAEPYDRCGTYVAAPDGCTLFQPDGGGALVLPEIPPLPPGTRARVRGDLQPCASFCFVDCVFQAQVSTCGAACRADFDGNGTVNSADIFAFLQAWFAGNLSADFDQSASLAVADIFGFIGAWFAGCP